MRNNPKSSVIIIGAGATGLMAAAELADSYHVTILEALDRTGGRILTFQTNGNRIEAGAEFIHGKLPLSLELVKKAGITLEEVEGNMYQVSGCQWKISDEIIEGWDELLKKMGSLEDDLTLDAFLELHFSDPEYESLRRHTRSYAAGFDLADPVKASVKALYKEWSAESDKQYRIKEGYGGMISYLQKTAEQKGAEILTGKRVKQIDWQKNEVTVYTMENEKYTAEKVIVTIPAGVLKTAMSYASINITPPLDNYDAAWQQIGYGSVLKIVLTFKNAFWQNGHDKVGFIFSEEIIPTWWTQLPSDNAVLTGWLGGPAAIQWDVMDDVQVLELAVTSLANIFGKTADEIVSLLSEHQIFRWHTSQTICGAYSYETPLSEEAKQLLITPVDNTLYFAGEALYSGTYPGTVEAALTSGRDTAKRLKSEEE